MPKKLRTARKGNGKNRININADRIISACTRALNTAKKLGLNSERQMGTVIGLQVYKSLQRQKF